MNDSTNTRGLRLALAAYIVVFAAKLAAYYVSGVVAVRGLRAEYVGPDTVHAGMRVAVKAGLPVEEATRIAAEVYRAVHEGQHSGYCFVEIEAAAAGH